MEFSEREFHLENSLQTQRKIIRYSKNSSCENFSKCSRKSEYLVVEYFQSV